MKAVCPELCPDEEKKLAVKLSSLCNAAGAATETLSLDLAKTEKFANEYECAVFHKDVILADMRKLREYCDELEEVTASEKWPFPTYSEILSSVKY